METLVYSIIGAGVLGILFTIIKSAWVKKQSAGSEKMQTIAGHIADGAMAFLKAEYKVLIVFVAAVAVLLFFKGESEQSSNGFIAVSFVVGAFLSAFAGFLGMRIAVKANVRTTNAARTSLNKALELNIRSPQIHYYLGQMHLKINDTTKATQSYRTALEILFE